MEHAIAEKRQPEIDREIGQLHAAVDNLSERVMELRDRLKPVLVSECPAPDGPMKTEEQPNTEIGMRIADARSTLRVRTADLNDIIQRLEV